MKNTDRRENDAAVSGICFVLYGGLLLTIALMTVLMYFTALHAFDIDASGDDISGWITVFGIFGMIAAAAEAVLAIGVIIFAAVYLILGILLIRGKPVFGIAAVSFLLSAVYQYLWLKFLSAHVGTGVINPVLIAGTVFFGVMALLLCSEKFSSNRWIVRKYWMLPFVLLAVSALIPPLRSVFLRLAGQVSYPMDIGDYAVYLPRLILLFPAYFFGCRWMKKKAEADQNPD